MDSRYLSGDQTDSTLSSGATALAFVAHRDKEPVRTAVTAQLLLFFERPFVFLCLCVFQVFVRCT